MCSTSSHRWFAIKHSRDPIWEAELDHVGYSFPSTFLEEYPFSTVWSLTKITSCPEREDLLSLRQFDYMEGDLTRLAWTIPKEKCEGWYQLCMQITWLGELGFMVLYFTSAQSQSKHSSVVYNWLPRVCAWLTFALNLQRIKLFHLDYGIQLLLLCFLNFSQYPFTSIQAGRNSANVSFVYQAEIMQQVFHSLLQAACLGKQATTTFYSVIQDRWIWL